MRQKNTHRVITARGGSFTCQLSRETSLWLNSAADGALIREPSKLEDVSDDNGNDDR